MNRIPRTPSPTDIEATASDWIVRLKAGLNAAEEKELNRWQNADARHRAALGSLSQTWSLLERPRHAGRCDEMVQALSSRAKRRRRRRTTSAALACVALVVASLTWQTSRPDPSAARQLAVLLIPEKRVLPDGGTVELKTGAEIAVDYAGELRRVTLLKGEALFHVAENKSRPFVVTARGIDVRAVGTAFLVAVGGQQVDVVVTHGRVAVDNRSRSSAPEVDAGSTMPTFSRLVDAGNRVTVETAVNAASPEVVAVSSIDMAARLAWCGPRVEFSDTPLSDAVALMNRHSKLHLIIDDPALAKLPVNGLFRVDNTETLVRLLEASFGVKADHAGDTVTLRRAR